MRETIESRQEPESEYRLLIEQVPAITYMAERGEDGRWYYVSPQIESILGFTPVEWMSDRRRWRKQLHPEDREMVLSQEQNLIGEGDRYRVEYRLLARDGHEVWVRDEATYVCEGKTGKLVMRGLLLDITERKQAEEELRKSQERLHTTLSTAPVILFALDAAGVFTFSAGKGLQDLGLKPGEVVGKSVFDVYRDHPKILDHVNRAQSGEEFSAVDEVPEHQRTYETRWAPARDRAGKAEGVIGVATDVTGQRAAEEALWRSEERYRVFVAQSSEGIFRTEFNPPISTRLPVSDQIATSLQSGHIAECNDAFARMYGYDSAAAMIGKALSELRLSDDSGEKFVEEFVSNGYRISDFESHRASGEGKTKVFQTTMIGIHENGSVARSWGIQRDVTERLQLEEQLRNMRQLEAIGRLAGGVAHDFNNALGIILGHVQLVSERPECSDQIRTGLGQVRRAADQAASLTRQLLAFSRKQVLQPKVLDLNDIVVEVQKMLTRVIGEDIELVTQLHPSLAGVKADPGQIEQVLMNLAVNARDAMPEGGRLTMETANVEADRTYVSRNPAALAGRCVLLRVKDTGHGMDAETLDHIFEPFFTTKEVGRGTGLGLATVYGIVKQSGGNISVSSEPGKGTTFEIFLPAESSSAVNVAAEVAKNVGGGTETILIVEDQPDLREVTRIFLERYGYHVLEAGGPEQALTLTETFPGRIHVMLTDVIMPGLSGRQLGERVLALRPDTKVVYMTGYTDDMVVQHKVLEPDVALLQKPFTPTELAQKIRAILDKSR
jgi:two-component system, cell cycle sensor histidine kinase and response regulator CckA